MNTFSKLEAHANEIVMKAKKGEPLSKEEVRILEIFNRNKSENSFNAGRRTKKQNKQKTT